MDCSASLPSFAIRELPVEAHLVRQPSLMLFRTSQQSAGTLELLLLFLRHVMLYLFTDSSMLYVFYSCLFATRAAVKVTRKPRKTKHGLRCT